VYPRMQQVANDAFHAVAVAFNMSLALPNATCTCALVAGWYMHTTVTTTTN